MAAHKDDDAVRARDALFAGIAHDLRNPLNTFAMSTGLLKDDLEGGDIDAARALSLVTRMERAAVRMQQLIDDLVLASRLESEMSELEPKPESIAEVVREALAAAAPIVKERGAEVAEGEIDGELRIAIDRPRIVQALVKAAAFVLRTTGERGVITIGAKRTAAGTELVVRGTNRGSIPSSAPGRDEGRGGLALLITRGYVAAHGGTIDLRYDDGTALTITLP